MSESETEPQDWIRLEMPENLSDQEMDEWYYANAHKAICPNCGNEVEVGMWMGEDCGNCGWMPPKWRTHIERQNANVEAYIHTEKMDAIDRQFANDPGQARIEKDQLEYEDRWDRSQE